MKVYVITKVKYRVFDDKNERMFEEKLIDVEESGTDARLRVHREIGKVDLYTARNPVSLIEEISPTGFVIKLSKPSEDGGYYKIKYIVTEVNTEC